jgi:hypothetical protein
LTYAVQTKIKIDDQASSKDMLYCVSCLAPATKYCQNDSAYFCDECDLQVHENPDMKLHAKGNPQL